MKKIYILIITVLVFISFGQMLLMQPWQDDNALMFKLSHIQEAAGFLGKGLLGEGPYRYTATPYYFVYKLVGYSMVYYYGLALLCYFLATFSIYFLFKRIISLRAGLLAGFLWAANYPTSDSFLRLFNSVSTSIGISFLSFLILCKWNFYKLKRFKWYLGSIIFYFLITEISYVRSAYLIGALLLFDILFLAWPLQKSSFKTFLQELPFLLIFIWQYIIHGDSRISEAGINLHLIASGNLGNLSSIFVAIGYLFSVDRLVDLLPNSIYGLSNNPYYTILIFNFLFLIVVAGVVWLLKSPTKTKNTILTILTMVLWLVISRYLFTKTSNLPFSYLGIEFLGGLILLALIAGSLFFKREQRFLSWFFLGIVIANVLSYWLYDPTVFYTTYNNRYLVHSYLGLIAALVVVVFFSQKKTSRFLAAVVIFWGTINILLNVLNQHQILVTRTQPINDFYHKLSLAQSSVPKGSIIYFGIEDDPIAHRQFDDITNSSQMPITTSIAWHYGVDRYDFQLLTDYPTFIAKVKDPALSLNNIYAYWYTKEGVEDRSVSLRQMVSSNSSQMLTNQTFESQPKLITSSHQTIWSQPDFVIPLTKLIDNLVNTNLAFDIKATLPTLTDQDYPLISVSPNIRSFFVGQFELKILAANYQSYRDAFRQTATIVANNYWQDKVVEHLLDGDTQTIWQADRVVWGKQPAVITVDNHQTDTFDRFVWVNAYPNNTPTKYQLEVSIDGQSWQTVSDLNSPDQRQPDEPQIIQFPPTLGRYFKLSITDTYNHDSPALSEVWLVPTKFSQLEIKQAEQFLKSPWGQINSPGEWSRLQTAFNQTGTAQLLYYNQSLNSWQTAYGLQFKISYDGQLHHYQLTIPAGVAKIPKIMLTGFTLPGNLTLQNAEAFYPQIR